MSDTAQLLADARVWLEQDPDPETRRELEALLASAESGSAGAIADLRSRFGARLAFGTAGLRGEIAAGPNRMNRVLVAQAAAGFARWLRENAGDGTPSVVIGYDGRKNSAVFARDTAELMVGAGVRAVLLPRLLPTPVLAFAVRHLGTSAGVMVTASHNPRNDNGYKVYLGGKSHGSQIVSPTDAEIAAHILDVARGSVAELPRSDRYEVAGEEVERDYIAATAAVASASAPRDAVSFAYTAMHGVGWRTAREVFARAGFAAPAVVTAQRDPDPAFPTVAFPNPEEPGAMNLAFATAREAGADLVIANDPDADRLAVAIPDPASTDGYRRLSGNEVGALLGWRAAELTAEEGGTLACSIVSSPALAAVAEAYRLGFANTLTGFKWVSRAPGLIFGYEEALGYLVNPQTLRDKDGISAATALLDLASSLAAEGRTIADQLDAFAERFGFFASDQISLRVSDVSRIGEIMATLRATPPSTLGAVAVSRIDDLSDGLGDLPPNDVLRILLADGSRVMVRPSGTEPKLKIYIDASSDEGTLAERRSTAAARVAALADAMRALTA
ncbi:phosphomannomutase [Leifsonia xyli subsp. xyli]|uniref:Phosphomannomutase n=2 Tax=Leifsonia xyli subsp. xyli TaxID=59736 RepID=Q6AGN7_LEIXX|nr:phospho-sugar mutase [Leifsonia xyli]AAT88458.1 phosphomannomutase [Leifsonia xyli subsp. xyli str. CTCB07]ODA91005.1 phosphomannomutase [Leifsonia xyli subsp. xyli]